MSHKVFRVFVGVVVAFALTVGSTISTVGYIEQSQIQIILSGPSGTVKCSRSAVVTAKVVSTKSGKPIRNQLVTWSLAGSQSGSDGLTARRTVTNKKGRTSVTLVFGPVAGARTVRASASAVAPTITVRCAGGLPKTAPRLPVDYVEQPSSILLRPPTVVESAPGDALPATGVRLDRLGIDLPIVEGDGVTVPEGAASHYPGTSWPGEGSNTYLYAHAREGNFLELWQVRTGDLVEVDMADGSVVEYRVSEILPIVRWDALEQLAPTDSERLTLQTSLWYDDTAPRFVVIAEPASSA
ncbi:MAG: sortase domain-bontaining protein [Chloroflexota bacterium]